MTTLVWDKIGERIYQSGVDHGVLYLRNDEDDETITAVPWNGLTGIEESSNSELRSFYLDGIKYLENLTPGDFLGKLKAFTYPDEFDLVNGIANPVPGLAYYEQPSKSFNLSYRTRVGNDVEGIEHGYKIHILYNILAVPDSQGFETFQDSGIQPIEFTWSLTGTPPKLEGFRPTVHVSMDSTKISPDAFEQLEIILYGTIGTDPYLPTIEEITSLFS